MSRLGPLVLALIALGPVRAAHADKIDPADVAHRWLEAARTGDHKALAKLSQLPLTFTSGHISDGAFVGCARSQVMSKAALVKATASWKDVESSPSRSPSRATVFDCRAAKPGPGQRLMRVEAQPSRGATDVEFDVGARSVVLRVSKAGKVSFISQLSDGGGI